MATPAFTPGEWRIDPDGGLARWNIGTSDEMVAIAQELLHDKGFARRDANANLIAASPELYNCVHDSYVTLKRMVDAGALPAHFQSLVDKHEAALSKARGEVQS